MEQNQPGENEEHWNTIEEQPVEDWNTVEEQPVEEWNTMTTGEEVNVDDGWNDEGEMEIHQQVDGNQTDEFNEEEVEEDASNDNVQEEETQDASDEVQEDAWKTVPGTEEEQQGWDENDTEENDSKAEWNTAIEEEEPETEEKDENEASDEHNANLDRKESSWSFKVTIAITTKLNALLMLGAFREAKERSRIFTAMMNSTAMIRICSYKLPRAARPDRQTRPAKTAATARAATGKGIRAILCSLTKVRKRNQRLTVAESNVCMI